MKTIKQVYGKAMKPTTSVKFPKVIKGVKVNTPKSMPVPKGSAGKPTPLIRKKQLKPKQSRYELI